jgi:hypothetical protein
MSSNPFLTGAIQSPFIFVPQSDNFITWTVVQGSDGTTPVTDCTGTATLYDEYGAAVPGADGIAFSTSGGGVYKATIPHGSFNPNPGRGYRLQIVLASSSLASTRTWWVESWVAEDDIA